MLVRCRQNPGKLIRLLAPVTALLILNGCGEPHQHGVAARPVVVERISLVRTQAPERYTGAVYARYEAPLGFRIAGKVVERRATLGETVKPGELLARLDAKDARLAAEAAEAALNAAMTQRDLANRELQRFRALRGKGVVSQAELDARNDAYQLATARLDEAQKQYDIARNQRAYTDLYADQAGVITAVDAEVGQVVAAGQPIFELARTGARELRVDIPEGRIEAIRRADTVKVSFWALPGREYTGKVREIAADADPATRTYLVKVTLPDSEPAIRLGMTGTATIDKAADGMAIQLPLSSLFHQGDLPAVWIVDAKREQVSLKPVGVARYLDNAVEIRDGLQPGELVVTRGVHRLHVGQKVHPVDLQGQPL